MRWEQERVVSLMQSLAVSVIASDMLVATGDLRAVNEICALLKSVCVPFPQRKVTH